MDHRPARPQRTLTAFAAWCVIAAGLSLAGAEALAAHGIVIPSAGEVDAVRLPVEAFVVRLLNQPFQVGMAVLFGGTLLFAASQFAAARLDRRSLLAARTRPRLAGFAALAAGRPPGTWNEAPGHDAAAALARYGSAASTMPLRLALWMFPMLGFLGTVIGLSGAINRLSGIIGRQGGEGDREMQRVLGELHLAFDTTIQGIVFAMVVIVLLAALERDWQIYEECIGGRAP